MNSLKQFQEVNCRGCFYADEDKVGTGQACCTHPQVPQAEDARCLTRKEVQHPRRWREQQEQRRQR